MPSVECGDGWYKLVYDMCKDLKDANPPIDFVVTKIAEKYGDLEVHTKNGTMRTRVILDQYNTQSTEICDECGNEKDLEMCDKCKIPEVDYSTSEDSDDDEDDGSSTSCGGSCAPASGGT